MNKVPKFNSFVSSFSELSDASNKKIAVYLTCAMHLDCYQDPRRHLVIADYLQDHR